VSIAERDYMRRNNGPPQIRWEHAVTIVVGAILVIAFSVQHCSTAADRDLSKGSLVVNVNKATAKELQTLLDVGPTRAQRIIQSRPYQSVDELFQKRVLPRAVVDENRSLLKTKGTNERRVR
jgi:DNA uptake protein ComE-like DNA-binding protein